MSSWMLSAPRGSFGSREVIVRCFDPFPGSLVLASCPLGLGPRAVSQLLSSEASMASEASSSSSSSITTCTGTTHNLRDCKACQDGHSLRASCMPRPRKAWEMFALTEMHAS